MDLATIGKEPIPGESPAGIDARYEPEFEALQREIDKLSSPSADQVDWQSIVTAAANILSRRSKDLSAAGYLAAGLLRTRRIDGLPVGVKLLADVVESYWDNLYPTKKRMRGRVGAIVWWIERCTAELKRLEPVTLSAESAQTVLDDLRRLDGFLSTQLPEAPSLKPLMRTIESYAPKISKPTATPVPAQSSELSGPKPTGAVATAPAAAKQGDETEPIANAQDARRAMDGALQRLRQVSLFLLQQNLKDPLAYRLRRQAVWIKVLSLPPHSDGVTQIVSPPPQVRDNLAKLRDERNWPAVIETAEQKFSQFIFWFDLNRFVAEALSELGAEHRAAHEAVCQETAGFIRRVPGAEKLSFTDGMAFADSDTVQWLQRIGSGAAVAADPRPAVDGKKGEDGQPMDAVLTQAHGLARQKKIVEAIHLIQTHVQMEKAGHRILRWRIAMARILLGVKKLQAVQPHLDQILQDIEEFGLERWDPALAKEGLVVAFQGFGAPSSNEQKSRCAEILQRIARIDPAEALRLTG
jgi:type VI secretion system protein VasJ